MYYISCIISHVLYLMYYISCIISHVLYLMYWREKVGLRVVFVIVPLKNKDFSREYINDNMNNKRFEFKITLIVCIAM